MVDEPAALVWAANFGALEWHAWTSRTDEPHQPTYALIDLDPGDDDHLGGPARAGPAAPHRASSTSDVARAAEGDRPARHPDLGADRAAGPDFDETRAWVEQLSQAVGAVVPELVSWKWEVRERGGLARLDYTQNAINKTLVAPYSPRPAPGAPGVGADRLGRARRPRRCARTASPSAPCSTGSPSGATCSATVLATDQQLPPLH